MQVTSSYLVTGIAERVGWVTATALTATRPQWLPVAREAAVTGEAVEVGAAGALSRQQVTLAGAGAVWRAGALWCGESRETKRRQSQIAFNTSSPKTGIETPTETIRVYKMA